MMPIHFIADYKADFYSNNSTQLIDTITRWRPAVLKAN